MGKSRPRSISISANQIREFGSSQSHTIILLISCLLVLNRRFQNMVSGTNDNIADTFSFICTSKCPQVMHVELFLPEGVIEI